MTVQLKSLFRFPRTGDSLGDASGPVRLSGESATRHVLELRPEHKGRSTHGCGHIGQHDLDHHRFLIVDVFDDNVVDHIVDTESGRRELRRLSAVPGVRVTITLGLEGNAARISDVMTNIVHGDLLKELIETAVGAGVRVVTQGFAVEGPVMVQKERT